MLIAPPRRSQGRGGATASSATAPAPRPERRTGEGAKSVRSVTRKVRAAQNAQFGTLAMQSCRRSSRRSDRRLGERSPRYPASLSVMSKCGACGACVGAPGWAVLAVLQPCPGGRLVPQAGAPGAARTRSPPAAPPVGPAERGPGPRRRHCSTLLTCQRHEHGSRECRQPLTALG